MTRLIVASSVLLSSTVLLGCQERELQADVIVSTDDDGTFTETYADEAKGIQHARPVAWEGDEDGNVHLRISCWGTKERDTFGGVEERGTASVSADLSLWKNVYLSTVYDTIGATERIAVGSLGSAAGDGFTEERVDDPDYEPVYLEITVPVPAADTDLSVVKFECDGVDVYYMIGQAT